MESNEELSKYLFQLKKLRRDRNKKRGDAPHKPVLLLAIIEGIENGDIISNRIAISPELVLSFKDIWSKIVVIDHLQNFSMPFFRLKSDGFWKLHSKHGSFIPRTISSFAGLREAIELAEMRSEEHTSELQSRPHLVCRLLLEKKKNKKQRKYH